MLAQIVLARVKERNYLARLWITGLGTCGFVVVASLTGKGEIIKSG